MVREIIEVLQVVAWGMIDAVLAAVLYVVVDRLGVAPVLRAKLPGKRLDTTSELDESIVDYCNEESENFAVEDCMARAHGFRSLGFDWPVVLSSLQREDDRG